jgi:hypothetical protein
MASLSRKALGLSTKGIRRSCAQHAHWRMSIAHKEIICFRTTIIVGKSKRMDRDIIS